MVSVFSLRKQLISYGFDDVFVSLALEYAELFNGDFGAFIHAIKELQSTLLTESDHREPHLTNVIWDEGVKQTEKDYNGDVLDYWGYSFSEESIRY